MQDLPINLIDIIILAVLVFFAWRGASKGLILTLFSLLAFFVAYFGASFVAATFSEPVADILEPSIQLSLREMVDDAASSMRPSIGSPSQGGGEEVSDPSATYSIEEILELIQRSEQFTGLQKTLTEAAERNLMEVTTTAVAAVSTYLARLVANALLFGISFLVILVVWFLVSRMMDLAFQLPILSAINTAGGLIFGLAKGVLVMLVVVWLARLAGVITDETAGPVANLMTVEGLGNLLLRLTFGEG